MSIDLDIKQLLRSPAVQAINFSYGRRQITASAFTIVSQCFSDQPMRGRIRVTINPAIVGNRSFAMYDPHDNKLNLRGPNVLSTPVGRSFVVHECTHAVFDIRGVRSWIPEEEAVCFIAEAIYLLHGTSTQAGGNGQPIIPGTTIPSDIIQVATDLRSRRTTNPNQIPAATDLERTKTQRSMRRDCGYQGGNYVSDGIPGRSI